MAGIHAEALGPSACQAGQLTRPVILCVCRRQSRDATLASNEWGSLDMRATGGAGDFKAKAIAGTHTVLIALDCPEARRKRLMGFAFQREIVGPNSRGAKYLRSLKVFKSLVPDPKNAHDPNDPSKPLAFYTDKFPVQSFLWGDYAASPGTHYRFLVQPMYGKPGALTTDPNDEIAFEITTEREWGDGDTHGVWFNRGAIASQKFAEEFGNKAPQNINDPDDPTVKWLSRGLLEACLSYINETRPGDALRVAAYEFTYPPILNALKALIDKGIDVQIVYHDTTDAKGRPNETAMEAAGLPVNDQQATYRRSRTKIPHNKFIVRLRDGTDPVEVWTGSTNFTPSGFLGQTNVGHRVADKETAKNYLAFWELVKTDPELDDARAGTAELTPDPLEVIAEKSIARLFSPRKRSTMLGWYGRRMLNAANSVWFTAAFGIAKVLIDPIAKKRDQMRFVLLEKPVPDAQRKALTADFNRVILSFGTPLGEIYRMKNGKPTARMPIKEFELDKWFFEEEHFRPKNDGFVFFVHTKFLLIDPLSDDPLVCSGSANFSSGSLLQNDENMLLVRGNTRIADIYMTEFDRIFRHFYFRDIANQLAAAKTSDDAKSIFLDETDEWSANYFKPRTLKNNRRIMFFEQPNSTWFANAATGSGSGQRNKVKKTTTPKKAKTAKKTAKKQPAKKQVAKKQAAKNARKKKAAKKAPARKAKKTAKTSVAKKKTAKRAVKSSARKKASAGKKSAKKSAKKATKKTARR
jgi:phosphatidylserine/phosphatidylglycerophosphate/cardiolipin synthase-like enzyme